MAWITSKNELSCLCRSIFWFFSIAFFFFLFAHFLFYLLLILFLHLLLIALVSLVYWFPLSLLFFHPLLFCLFLLLLFFALMFFKSALICILCFLKVIWLWGSPTDTTVPHFTSSMSVHVLRSIVSLIWINCIELVPFCSEFWFYHHDRLKVQTFFLEITNKDCLLSDK